jgi:hypothetical protein
MENRVCQQGAGELHLSSLAHLLHARRADRRALAFREELRDLPVGADRGGRGPALAGGPGDYVGIGELAHGILFVLWGRRGRVP